MNFFFCHDAKIQYLGLNLITSTYTEQILNTTLLYWFTHLKNISRIREANTSVLDDTRN